MSHSQTYSFVCHSRWYRIQVILPVQMLERNLPLPDSGQAVSFGDFLAELFTAFKREGIHPCVLRNYEGFPNRNVGGDIDLLIVKAWLQGAVNAVRSVSGIRIIGFVERFYVAHLFIEGVAGPSASRALQVDLIWNSNWKGQPYLPAKLLLDSSKQVQAGDVAITVPAPIHEAIVSLLGSLLNGGVIKEKYFARVQETFSKCRSEAIQALAPPFGADLAGRLVDYVTTGNRPAIVASAKALRAALALRCCLAGPFRCISAAAQYYRGEFAVRRLPRGLETIRIVGQRCADWEGVVEASEAKLQNAATLVQWHRLGTTSLPNDESSEPISTHPQRTGPCIAWLRVTAQSLKWVIEGWLSQFANRTCLTIVVWDSCCPLQPFVSEEKRARIANSLVNWFLDRVPEPDLWIVLDPNLKRAERILEVDSQAHRVACECQAKESRIPQRRKVIAMDAGKEPACVIEAFYAAIIDALAQRTNARLKRRFSQLDVSA